MSDRLRWLSPFDPRGMSLYGMTICALLSIGLWSVSGTFREVWPNRCSLFRAQLVEGSPVSGADAFKSPLSVIADGKHTQLHQQATYPPLWELKRADGQTIIRLPALPYERAELHQSPFSPHTLSLFYPKGSITVFVKRDYPEYELFNYLAGVSHSKVIAGEKDSILRSSVLQRRGLTITPDVLTCHRDHAEEQVINLLALALKSQEHGLQKSWIIHQESWLNEYRFEQTTQYRLYQTLPVVSQVRQVIWNLPASSTLSREESIPAVPTWLSQLFNRIDHAWRDSDQAKQVWTSPTRLIIDQTHPLRTSSNAE